MSHSCLERLIKPLGLNYPCHQYRVVLLLIYENKTETQLQGVKAALYAGPECSILIFVVPSISESIHDILSKPDLGTDIPLVYTENILTHTAKKLFFFPILGNIRF